MIGNARPDIESYGILWNNVKIYGNIRNNVQLRKIMWNYVDLCGTGTGRVREEKRDRD